MAILKIIAIVLIVLVLIIIYLAELVQVRRYWRLRHAKTLQELDKKYVSRTPGKLGVEMHRIVVSMSTIPDRIHLIGPTLASLLDQTVKPHEIAINIPHISRKGLKYTIPDWLSNLKSVKIHRVDKDEGPGTKLLPTLRRENPGTRIIVVDDDNIYNSGMIEHLLREFNKRDCEKRRVCLSNYGFHLNHDGMLPVLTERLRAIAAGPEEIDILQGFSGFVVLKEFFPQEVYEHVNCPKECISVDDIWFTGWLYKNGVKIETPGHIYRQIPIINFGKIRATPSLANGENAGFVTDQVVINWFMHSHGFIPVKSR